jgi:hypothetical protein
MRTITLVLGQSLALELERHVQFSQGGLLGAQLVLDATEGLLESRCFQLHIAELREYTLVDTFEMLDLVLRVPVLRDNLVLLVFEFRFVIDERLDTFLETHDHLVLRVHGSAIDLMVRHFRPQVLVLDLQRDHLQLQLLELDCRVAVRVHAGTRIATRHDFYSIGQLIVFLFELSLQLLH